MSERLSSQAFRIPDSIRAVFQTNCPGQEEISKIRNLRCGSLNKSAMEPRHKFAKLKKYAYVKNKSHLPEWTPRGKVTNSITAFESIKTSNHAGAGNHCTEDINHNTVEKSVHSSSNLNELFEKGSDEGNDTSSTFCQQENDNFQEIIACSEIIKIANENFYMNKINETTNIDNKESISNDANNVNDCVINIPKENSIHIDSLPHDHEGIKKNTNDTNGEICSFNDITTIYDKNSDNTNTNNDHEVNNLFKNSENCDSIEAMKVDTMNSSLNDNSGCNPLLKNIENQNVSPLVPITEVHKENINNIDNKLENFIQNAMECTVENDIERQHKYLEEDMIINKMLCKNSNLKSKIICNNNYTNFDHDKKIIIDCNKNDFSKNPELGLEFDNNDQEFNQLNQMYTDNNFNFVKFKNNFEAARKLEPSVENEVTVQSSDDEFFMFDSSDESGKSKYFFEHRNDNVEHTQNDIIKGSQLSNVLELNDIPIRDVQNYTGKGKLCSKFNNTSLSGRGKRSYQKSRLNNDHFGKTHIEGAKRKCIKRFKNKFGISTQNSNFNERNTIFQKNELESNLNFKNQSIDQSQDDKILDSLDNRTLPNLLKYKNNEILNMPKFDDQNLLNLHVNGAVKHQNQCNDDRNLPNLFKYEKEDISNKSKCSDPKIHNLQKKETSTNLEQIMQIVGTGNCDLQKYDDQKCSNLRKNLSNDDSKLISNDDLDLLEYYNDELLQKNQFSCNLKRKTSNNNEFLKKDQAGLSEYNDRKFQSLQKNSTFHMQNTLDHSKPESGEFQHNANSYEEYFSDDFESLITSALLKFDEEKKLPIPDKINLNLPDFMGIRQLKQNTERLQNILENIAEISSLIGELRTTFQSNKEA